MDLVRHAGEPLVGTPIRGDERDDVARAGAAANEAAAQGSFEDYRQRKAAETVRAHDADLARWSAYLSNAAVSPRSWALNPSSWTGVTWGLVDGFVRWQVEQGYAIGSINRALSTVKQYAKLAAKAGTLDHSEAQMIRAVTGYGYSEGRKADEKRAVSRIGPKKAAPVELTQAQAQALKTAHLDTPQGWRDALLMCLLLDHGLRVSEVYDIQLENLSFEEAKGWMKFYRRKVGKEQRHALTPDTLRTARAYVAARGPWAGQLMYGSEQSGELTGRPMSMRALNKRVRLLGEAAGVAGLSPHDCRHFWASAAAPHTPARVLQEAGGWNSSATALRYQRAAAIANEGVVLPDSATSETVTLQRKARGRPSRNL